MKRVWMCAVALVGTIGLVTSGCMGPTDIEGGISPNLGSPTNVNVTTGDTTQNQTQTNTQTTTVSQITNLQIGDNIMIQGGDVITTQVYEQRQLDRPCECVIEEVVEEEIADPEPECIPVEEITEDRIIGICITLAINFEISTLEAVYFQLTGPNGENGLEGVIEVPAAELDFSVEGQVCFSVEFLGDLGIDPFAALGVSGVGSALNCIYSLETSVGITPEIVTEIVQEGVDCPDDEALPTTLE